MEKILLFQLTSLWILILLLLMFILYKCITLRADEFYNSGSNNETISLHGSNNFWSSIVRIIPKRTRDPTKRDTVTAPEEIMYNQPTISSVEKDQRKEFQRRNSTPM